MISIDTDNSGSLNYDQTTQLDGREYVLDFIWSDLESCWYMNILDQGGNQLAMLIRLNISWPLLRRFKDSALPPGILFCYDISETQTEIQAPGDLGTRVLLVYIEASDPPIANAQARDCIITVAPGFSATAGSLIATVRDSDPPVLFANVDSIPSAHGSLILQTVYSESTQVIGGQTVSVFTPVGTEFVQGPAKLTVDFQALAAGPVSCPAHSLVKYIPQPQIPPPLGTPSPVPSPGWAAIDNPDAASIGRGF